MSHDLKFDRAMAFAENLKDKKQKSGISNIYVIEKVDLDGNVIDEYYGMNMMTDYGMSQFFVSNASFPTNIYIGNGTGTFNHTTKVLLSAITTLASTTSSSTKDYNYPLYYDSSSGLITCICKYITSYFDYNISGITNAVTVSEYGIGTSYDNLWTHSWVYDSTGSQTYVTKNINERLNITVYLCLSYNESLITSGWTAGRYTIITSLERFLIDKMYESSIYTYKRYDLKASRSNNHTSSSFIDNTITRYTNLNELVLYPGSDNTQGYIDGFCQYSNGFVIVEPQMLSTGESFSVIQKPMTYGDDCISYAVGENTSNMQFTQMDVSSVNLFNINTGLWDNVETFSNDPNHHYDESNMGITFPVPLYYTNNNTLMKMYVYQNLCVDDPILSITDNGLSTIYVTDKYWDKTTWQLLTDLTNIPVALRSKHYFITPSNTIPIKPNRSSSEFRLIKSGGDAETYLFDLTIIPTINRGNNLCDNVDKGWYMNDNIVYSPANNLRFTVGTSTNIITMTYDKWLLVFSSEANTYNLYDMSSLSTAPTPTTMTLPFTTSTNAYNGCYRTESGTGVICLQSTSTNECVIIDMRNNTFTQTMKATKLACCIWGNDDIAYLPTDDATVLKIYNITTNADTKQFTIPSGVTTIPFMFAHKNHIWITNGSTYSYLFNTTDDTIVAANYNIGISSNLQYVMMSATTEAMIIYKHNVIGSNSQNNIYYVLDTNPTVPGSLSSFNAFMNTGRLTCVLRKVHNNTLALIIVGGDNTGNTSTYLNVYDFGRFMKTGEISSRSEVARNVVCYSIFGTNVIRRVNTRLPLEYFLDHKITGTTKTISTVNSIKSLTGKQWSTVITNIPEFNGIPSGIKQ